MGLIKMRLIDQTGHIDVLYDNCTLSVVENMIRAFCLNNGGVTMGVYETEEDALAELQRLHKAYQRMDISVFQFR